MHASTPAIDPQLSCHDITVYARRSLAACLQYLNRAMNSSLLDISDPTNPEVVSQLKAPPTAQWMTFSAFTPDGDFLIASDTGEPFDDTMVRHGARCTGPDDQTGRLYIYDVRNEYDPQLVGSFALPRRGPSDARDCGPLEIGVIPLKDPERYIATVAWMNGGLSIIDLSDPANPSEIAYWEAGRHRMMKAAYWYNGRIYATEAWTLNGVRVFEVGGLDPSNAHVYRDRLNPQTQLRVGN